MRVSEAMTEDVKTVAPDSSIRQAAEMMASLGVGLLPVADKEKLVGMISDRDIAVRAVAKGLGPDTKVRDAMSPEVRYCFVDQLLDEVSQNMGEIQVRRLPVLDRNKRLVGIIALGDIANCAKDAANPAKALTGISRPGGQHSQTAAA